MAEELNGETISSRLDAYLESEAETESVADALLFSSLEEFVEDYVTQVIRLPYGEVPLAWCPSWWAHPEAVARLTTMWRAMEYLRDDVALGMSVWWRDHFDPHMRMLRDPLAGPFAACRQAGGHIDQPPLPTEAPPSGMLDHPAFSLEAALAEEAPTAEEIRNSPRPWLGWIALTMPPDNDTV
ncbi:DUF4913 domain-containing protein [Streptomyces lancefieldiae]|uniref:DUF4913 domain-containing protein n=1 Tax=Streptomyces lancefieldiae TaxID=3075520 RepID=A0ABU3ATA2_9ACTN|nr:DUF4913 domain-containing protein [Streptomyces sp. DSM 40712]MDT0612031.1 DUF4913 domain-containing protein [Streptomyces sp. DSM 40712]